MKRAVFLLSLIVIFLAIQMNANYETSLAAHALKIAKEALKTPRDTVKVRSFGKNIEITPANINVKIDRDGNMPIHYAAEHRKLTDVAKLISQGALPTSINNWNQTPLMKAVQGRNLHTVAYLLDQNAPLTQERYPVTHFTPFHYAVDTAHHHPRSAQDLAAIISILGQYDTAHQFINSESKAGTPLEMALKKKVAPAIIKALLNNGARITRKVQEIAQKNGMNNLLVSEAVIIAPRF